MTELATSKPDKIDRCDHRCRSFQVHKLGKSWRYVFASPLTELPDEPLVGPWVKRQGDAIDGARAVIDRAFEPRDAIAELCPQIGELESILADVLGRMQADVEELERIGIDFKTVYELKGRLGLASMSVASARFAIQNLATHEASIRAAVVRARQACAALPDPSVVDVSG